MLIAVAQYRPGANWKLMTARQARTKRSQGEKLNRHQVCGDWEARAGRALFVEPSQSAQNARLVLSHSGNDRYRNIRSPGSTHLGCRSTTPAVRLAPGRRSNGLSKQSRFAWFALPVRFSPAANPTAYSARSRTPFHADGGQHSAVMADSVPHERGQYSALMADTIPR